MKMRMSTTCSKGGTLDVEGSSSGDSIWGNDRDRKSSLKGHCLVKRFWIKRGVQRFSELVE